ncbi:MAG: ferritin-like domain-containing protein [Planctomycetaceae bacterium]|jgi:uncharacterized ferritin-like protein (DUF455 family)
MELRQFAEQVLLSTDLVLKLTRPGQPLTDDSPGSVLKVSVPGRPADLQFAERRSAPAMPRGSAFRDPARRAVAHHIMANHELQALEVMAMVLLAFPDAPPDFRSGLARIMFDEQRHTRLHAQRCSELGVSFGSRPVNSWIWQKALLYSSPLEYVAGLPLVFEGANLDHTVEFEHSFMAVGDRRSAAIMRAIHRDEIRHVEFGLTWLRRWKRPDQSDWDAWVKALHWPIRPSKARGQLFQAEARREAGLTDDFIQQLADYSEDPDTKSTRSE